ncbi:hypothetical protein ACFLU2_01165 [Chloroflexota bacterium]
MRVQLPPSADHPPALARYIAGYEANGEVLVRLGLGRGSNYFHDFYSKFLTKRDAT